MAGKRSPCRLVRGDCMGQWSVRFSRNDGLCCNYEPHLLLCNLGLVDWRPCLNFWAVVEYITKYATKAPSGSKRLGVVVKEVMEELCRHGTVSGHGMKKQDPFRFVSLLHSYRFVIRLRFVSWHEFVWGRSFRVVARIRLILCHVTCFSGMGDLFKCKHYDV